MTIRAFDVSRTALLCLLLGSWLSACHRDKDTAAQGTATQSASPSSAAQPLTARLPKDWPSQVPTYPGGKIVTGMNTKAGDLLVLRTNDAPAKVVDFYKAQLSTMHLVKSVDKGAMQSLSWSDDAQPPLRVTLSVGTAAQTNTTFANLKVTHTASDDATDVAAAAGQAGAAAQ
jgi:hypothetical protein